MWTKSVQLVVEGAGDGVGSAVNDWLTKRQKALITSPKILAMSQSPLEGKLTVTGAFMVTKTLVTIVFSSPSKE